MLGNFGEGPPGDEVPSLAHVYELYDNNELQEFVDGADLLLEHPAYLNRYHRIHLLLMLANSVEDPADTHDYFIRAEDEYRTARMYHDLPEEVRILDELRVKLDTMSAVVQAEREEAQRQEATECLRAAGGVGSWAEPASYPALLVDGAADTEGMQTGVSTEGIESSGSSERGPATDMALRPKPHAKPSKFEGSLKLKKQLQHKKSKSEIRSLSNIFDTNKAEQTDSTQTQHHGPAQKDGEHIGEDKMQGLKYVEEERSMQYE